MSGLSRSRIQPTPSWPAVIATTVRLWMWRHRRIRVRGLMAIVCLGVAAALAVAAIEFATSPTAVRPRTTTADPQSLAAVRDAARIREQAASWIADQVDSGAVIACDPAMCADLESIGLQAGRLLMVGTAAADPLGSDLVVATPALQSQFGDRLDTVFAPLVIASFGSGAERIDIRATAIDGATAYQKALARDRQSRLAAGAELLRNRHVTVSGTARAALAGGEVDPRLLITLAALTARQRVRIESFGDSSPGTSPLVVPFRSAVLAPARSGARLATELGSMSSFLDVQQPPFRPIWIRGAGTSLSVEYGAPGPLGLLN